jgi:hypothetical protein
MTDFVFLALFLFFVQLGIGGGWYETLVMYPRWKEGAAPENLVQKLTDTGQLLANKRYWPFISPVGALLSIVNIVLAWRSTSDARTPWLAAALIIFVKCIATYAYFAPTMVRRFQHPEKIEPQSLARSVRTWTFFSPMRVPVEVAAWILGAWALFLLR